MTVDQEIRAGLSDSDALWLTLWGEARSEPVEGLIAVAQVIRNRTLALGRSYAAVCFSKRQFSCWSPAGGAHNYLAVMALARGVHADHASVITVPVTAVISECKWVAEGVIGGRVRDNTHGSTHYCTQHLLGTHPPLWSLNEAPVARIGDHVFFKLATPKIA